MPKQQITVEVPSALRDFLQDVVEEIDAGSNAALIPSDDLLQTKCAYGGLDDPVQGMYYFTFFPEADTVVEWQLHLSVPEIRELASGGISKLELWACDYERCRARFSREDGYCSYCQYWLSRGFDRPGPEEDAACQTPRQWVELFWSRNPAATGWDVYDAYTNTEGLESRLGPIPPDEASDLWGS